MTNQHNGRTQRRMHSGQNSPTCRFELRGKGARNAFVTALLSSSLPSALVIVALAGLIPAATAQDRGGRAAAPLTRDQPARAAAPTARPAASTAPAGTAVSRLGAVALTLPVKVVDGHLIISVTLQDSNGVGDPISLELVLEEPRTVLLHPDQYGWLKLDTTASRQGFVRLSFASGEGLEIPASEVAVESDAARGQEQNRVTRLFSQQLHDRKIKGCIGLGFLRHYQVSLDLAAGQLKLAPLAEVSTFAGAIGRGATFSGNFQQRDGRIVLPVNYAQGSSGRLILGSSRFDTLLDPAVASRLGEPAGDIGQVAFVGQGNLELSRYVAFRPRAFAATARPTAAAVQSDGAGAMLLSGVNLLEFFRLEIDWAGTRVNFFKQKEPGSQEADRAYFRAEQGGTTADFEAFLQAHLQSRLAAEAATRLIRLRLEEWGLDEADLLRAFQWVLDTSLPDRRTEIGRAYVERIAGLIGYTDAAIKAAKLSLEHSRQALTVQEVYRLHRILGEQYLLIDELDPAWRHFMSAAFVTLHREPQHTFLVAYGLAQVYERQGRTARAYSRYQAALASGFSVPTALREKIAAKIARLRSEIPADDLLLLDS